MHKILLISFEKYLDQALNVLDKRNVIISAIITLPTVEVENVLKKHHVKCPILSYWNLPEAIANYYFDYIFIDDGLTEPFNGFFGKNSHIEEELLSYGVEKNKIVNLMGLNISLIASLPNLLKYYLASNEHFEIFVTGLSYAEVGIDLASFDAKAINFACSSQDLFYDYEIAKLVLQKEFRRPKYAIIGVAPYSFHYDLSYTNDRHRILGYYPTIKKAHNYCLDDQKINYLFNDLYKDIYKNISPQLMFDLNKNFCERTMRIKEYLFARKGAEIWNQKEYPKTVEENKKTLLEYIKSCINCDVKPIVVLFPFTSIWRSFFSRKKLDEFYFIIRNLQQDIPFDFLDYYNNENFADSDFYDEQHLNKNGSKKLTRLINSAIFNQR